MKRFLLLSLVLLISLGVFACGAPTKVEMLWGSTTATSGFYPPAVAKVALQNKYVPEVNCTVVGPVPVRVVEG